ncbi:hypothetical protein BDZ89DRAFT_1070855 [Hymenopellis radicata]|nr:hypothetical protein BDZ89DRAFT_1070855 [Hymenopellis radicata]
MSAGTPYRPYTSVEEYLKYDFDSDQDFQQGLANILASNPAPTITGGTLTSGDLPASDAASEPHTLTFAQLQALIESGRVDEIPNNKPISGELNDDPPSQSTASPVSVGENTDNVSVKTDATT